MCWGDDGDRLWRDERRRRANELLAFEVATKPVDFNALETQLREIPGTSAIAVIDQRADESFI